MLIVSMSKNNMTLTSQVNFLDIVCLLVRVTGLLMYAMIGNAGQPFRIGTFAVRRQYEIKFGVSTSIQHY